MKDLNILAVIASAGLLVILNTPLPAAAEDGHRLEARLTGYQETPFTINSAASGEFKARIHPDGTAIDYELTYRDLSSSPTQAHIHFGRPAITGMIVLFLCTNLTPLPAGVPAPQACPTAPATITGTLTAADVIPRPQQGIDSGAAGFAEMLKALRAGAAYANVHTTTFPSGEIRGKIKVKDEEFERRRR